jgi:hypothetical protein
MKMCGLVSELSLLLYRSVSVFMPHHAVLVTMALWYVLELSSVMPQALLFLLNIALPT